MGDGELQKRIKSRIQLGDRFDEILWVPDVLEIIEEAKRDFPKERLGYCDIAIPEKGRCWIRPTYKDVQEWFAKWFGEAT